MRNKYNSNDSLFSLEYKIPYEKSSIEQHLEESQQEINFIKVKLTEAYEKLEAEIKSSTHLEEQNDLLTRRLRETQEKYLYEKKENSKLKETLEVILKNRKIMQEEMEHQRDTANRKVTQRDAIIDQLQREMKTLNSKCSTLSSQLQEKTRLLREYSDRLREESQEEDHRQSMLNHRIDVLQQEIARITEEKFVEVSRLRHQLQLYQRSTTPAKETEIKIEEGRRQQRKRDFSRAAPRRVLAKFDTRVSQESQSSQFNKENVHSLQLNIPNTSFTESSISKWKRPGKQLQKEEANQSAPVNAPIIPLETEDQQLTQYQMTRKKAEQELCALQKIKRPTQQQRQKMGRLQRQIYHLDSDIAGLKRKIRRKY